MKIFVKLNLNNSEKELLKQKSGNNSLIFADELDTEESEKKIRQAEITFGNISAEWLMQSPNIRWLQLESVGFDEYRELDWSKLNNQLTITNLKGMFGTTVAETALAAILSLYRGINTVSQLKPLKQWVGTDLRPDLRVLHDKEVLVLGSGSIGSKVKSLLEAFRCYVTVFGRTASSGDIYTLEELDKKLSNFDIIVSCLPETSETKGLFTKDRINCFKSTALFVNVGRGSVINEQALIESLQNNSLAGAVLDVTQQEPIPENHPLWDCPNTIITQHTAGGSADELHQKVNLFLKNLSRYQSGKKLLNIVNFKKGY